MTQFPFPFGEPFGLDKYYLVFCGKGDRWELVQIEPDHGYSDSEFEAIHVFEQDLIKRWIDDGPIMFYRVLVTGQTLTPAFKGPNSK